MVAQLFHLFTATAIVHISNYHIVIHHYQLRTPPTTHP